MGSTVQDKADTEKGKPTRQRKAHRKSRQGCGNCKLRGVKCDESTPTCKRCAASSFACNYTRSAPELQLAHVGAFKLDLSPGLPMPTPSVGMPIALPVPGRVGNYDMRLEDFAALDRFHKRTVQHLGTPQTRKLFSNEAYGLGASNPFLLHVFLALTLIHDSHLAPSSNSLPITHRSHLAFHWYHGTVLLKRKLARPPTSFTGSERDALWAASALLGAAAFAYLDSDDPDQVWPLTPPNFNDLDWLKMSDGKKAVWDVVDPLRPESAFHSMAVDLMNNPAPDGSGAIPPNILPALFYEVFNLRDSSPSSGPRPDCAADNPYHVPACVLAHILHDTVSANNILRLMTFTTQIGPRFKALLVEKDARALLLMAWWYAKTSAAEAWWLRRRSLVEGLAICRFVERACKGDERMLELLKFPMVVLETAMGEEEARRTGVKRGLGRLMGPGTQTV